MQKRSVEFGVGIPTGTEGLMYPVPFVNDVEDNIHISIRAEELGYASVWGNDHVATQSYVIEDFHQPPNYYAPLITLAAVAAKTTKLKMATALLVLPNRHPGLLAKELATLDQIAGGRLQIGVGLGAYREEFEALYGDFSKGKVRGEMLDESLEIMQKLFTEDKVSFQGKYFQVKDLQTYPKPVNRPFPFYIGGNSKKGLDRVVKYATGWLPSGFTPAEMKDMVGLLTEKLSTAGRDISQIDVAPQFSVALGRTHEEAWEKYTSSQQYRHMLSLAESTMKGMDLDDCINRDLIGTPDEVAGRIQEYIDAGENRFTALLFTANTLPQFYDEMEWFAQDVMSRF